MTTGWSGSLLKLLSSDITETELLEIAKSDDVEKRGGQLCEAYFWIGSTNLISGNKTEAVSYFKRCVGTGRSMYAEYDSAQAELRRLVPSRF